jgi:hypothetical protein
MHLAIRFVTAGKSLAANSARLTIDASGARERIHHAPVRKW